MEKLRNLEDATKEEQLKFLNSFDKVFIDLDGVIWRSYVPLEGAAACTHNLKKLGKQVKYVSNNAFYTPEEISKNLQKMNHDVTSSDVINPIVSIISYFKSIEFKDEIYFIGTPALKQAFLEAGFKIAPDVINPKNVQNNLPSVLEYYEENPKIKAVVFETDLSINYIQIQKAIWYLKQPDCQLVIGTSDKHVPSKTGNMLGMYYFAQSIKEVSGKNAVYTAKPSPYFADLLKSMFNITDPKKVLMIGDSIEQDMATAALGGYQKLLVLSGVAKISDIHHWNYAEEYKPEYYVKDLNTLNNVIRSVYKEL